MISSSLLRSFTQVLGGVAKKVTVFTQEALSALGEYSWPGNIRELENRIKRAVIMTEASRVTAADLELLSASTPSDGSLELQAALDSVRRKYIEGALTQHQGNLTLAAASLRLSRPTLYDQMEKVGIRRKS